MTVSDLVQISLDAGDSPVELRADSAQEFLDLMCSHGQAVPAEAAKAGLIVGIRYAMLAPAAPTRLKPSMSVYLGRTMFRDWYAVLDPVLV